MLQLQGTVVDANTGAALPGATLTLDGAPIGVTDSNGKFNIQTANEGASFTVSYVGYNNNEYPVDQVADMEQIPMTLSSAATNLQPVTVTPQTSAPIQATNAPASWLPLILAGGALLLLGGGKKKKAVGAIDTNTILIAGAGIAAVYFLTRPKAVAVPAPVPVYSSAYLQSNAGNPVAQDIAAGAQGASGLANLVDAVSNF